MSKNLLDDLYLVKGLDPVADGFAGTVYSDVFEVLGDGAFFIIYKGVGTTGTSTITVEACDDITPTNSTAVAFYKKTLSSGVWSAATAVAATGFATTAGSSDMYLVWVDAEELGTEGYGYVRLKAVEVANDPVLGGIICGVYGLRDKPPLSSLID